MSEFFQINLDTLIQQLGEDKTKSILTSFSCHKNQDVDDFIHRKAIIFSKNGLSKTYLVYWASDSEKEFVGYYTLAQKSLTIAKKDVSAKIYRKILNHGGQFDTSLNKAVISMPLIAQLGKNYNSGNDTLISGDELLAMALDRISEIQIQIGGNFTYLECEDNPKLLDFYQQNGFVPFGKRRTDKDESLDSTYLIQLLKYIKNE